MLPARSESKRTSQRFRKLEAKLRMSRFPRMDRAAEGGVAAQKGVP